MKTIVAITLQSLQQLIRGVAIKFEVIGLYKKKIYYNNSKYFNGNFDGMIYIYIYIYMKIIEYSKSPINAYSPLESLTFGLRS